MAILKNFVAVLVVLTLVSTSISGVYSFSLSPTTTTPRVLAHKTRNAKNSFSLGLGSTKTTLGTQRISVVVFGNKKNDPDDFDIFENVQEKEGPFSFLSTSKPSIVVSILLLLLVTINPISIVSPGEVGVVTTFGTTSQIGPGIHIVNPLSSVTYFSTKTLLLDQVNFVPTREGLTVELDTSVLYRIKPDSAQDIYVQIGQKYEQTIVIPEVSSAVRGLTSESEAKALYSGGGRNLIQNQLKDDLSGRLEPRGIVIEDVLLKNLKLPAELTKSIELKAKAEQDSSRMEFVLTKEKQEAERKAVEAQGIAEFQRIVSDGISPNLLKWKGIEATEKLATSPNSKIVIVGSGKDGLPIILGGSEGSPK